MIELLVVFLVYCLFKETKKMKTIIIYKSQYGSTEQYAKWLAEMLNCEAVNASQAKNFNLGDYDVVILGGGLYAGGIGGAPILKKQFDKLKNKKVVVFTVGLADPAATDYTKIINMGFTSEQQKNIRFFHLRGKIDYSKLNAIHKVAMAALKFMVSHQKESKRIEEDEQFLETYGKTADFMNRDTLLSIVDYVNACA